LKHVKLKLNDCKRNLKKLKVMVAIVIGVMVVARGSFNYNFISSGCSVGLAFHFWCRVFVFILSVS